MWQIAILCVAFLQYVSADTANNTLESYHTFGSNNTFYVNVFIDSHVNGLQARKNASAAIGGAGQSSSAEIKSFLLSLTNVTGSTNGLTGVNSANDSHPVDCYEVLQKGSNASGVYKIQPMDSEPFDVYCDQDTDGGGWTVFQNRFNGNVDFDRNWVDYKKGFGELDGEFWLGLENLYFLTNQKENQIRFYMEDFEHNTVYASYSKFGISSEVEFYQLNSVGDYSGSADDRFSQHKGFSFTTKDEDHDTWSDGNYAERYGGGWWHIGTEIYFTSSLLNGPYHNSTSHFYLKGVFWVDSNGPISSRKKKSRMMIKPAK